MSLLNKAQNLYFFPSLFLYIKKKAIQQVGTEIADEWIEGGIIPEKHIAFYCGTGWRGSEAFMNAYLMGWPNISVYDGGWFEWSSDPDNPIATGEPESN